VQSIKERLISTAAWMLGVLAFIPLGSIILLLSLFIKPKYFDPFVKACCRMILRFLWIRIQVEGRELVQPQRTYLFMANHVNIFDVFVLYGYIPGFVRGVELDEHFEWLFYGLLIRRLGVIPISHTNVQSAVKSLQHAKRTLDEGTSIVILPEGGRTLDGRLSRFKRGAFMLAKEAQVDIVPIIMVGAYQIKRKGCSLIRPGNMTLRFGEPISYQDIKVLDVREMKSYVRQRMLTLFYQ
jgi:1-acyl-sn-glycerol-3-phosphate acyltransferase